MDDAGRAIGLNGGISLCHELSAGTDLENRYCMGERHSLPDQCYGLMKIAEEDDGPYTMERIFPTTWKPRSPRKEPTQRAQRCEE